MNLPMVEGGMVSVLDDSSHFPDTILDMFETFDHTADLGLRISAADLPTLFAEAARALFAIVIENPESIRPLQTWRLDIPGDDREYLLFDFLRELLYCFDVEHVIVAACEVQLRSDGLSATMTGETLEPGRHELSHEVKAITTHGLRVEPTPNGWIAEVIVDI